MNQTRPLQVVTTLTAAPPLRTQALSPGSILTCEVEGCRATDVWSCEVRVTDPYHAPGGETHLVLLCQNHHENFHTLKWEWGLNADAGILPDTNIFVLEEVEVAPSETRKSEEHP